VFATNSFIVKHSFTPFSKNTRFFCFEIIPVSKGRESFSFPVFIELYAIKMYQSRNWGKGSQANNHTNKRVPHNDDKSHKQNDSNALRYRWTTQDRRLNAQKKIHGDPTIRSIDIVEGAINKIKNGETNIKLCGNKEHWNRKYSSRQGNVESSTIPEFALKEDRSTYKKLQTSVVETPFVGF
jgi:hypothetical protein